LIDIIYCTVDTKTTPLSVQAVGVDFYIDMVFASPQRYETCTQHPIQWEPGALSLGVKRPGREVDHSPVSNAEVKEGVELYPHSPNTSSWRGAHLKYKDIKSLNRTPVSFDILLLERYFITV
jgi:hypothetical protein